MGKNITIKVNGKEIAADSDKTILNVARENGIDIPAMCYDPRLEPFRSCLVCVVEDKRTNKLLMSCAVPVQEGMDIETDSPAALEARKAALELLLSTHYADCRGPCHQNCPAQVDVQGYLALANAGKYREALQLIRETNPMPIVCGRVCVRYCEANCRRNYVDTPAAINFVKRYVADLEYDRLELPPLPPKNGKRVAIVGGGPSGLTCAYFLALKGYEVTIFESHPKLGGMLRYGIPEYRLSEKMLDKEINFITSHGINVETGVKIGTDFTLDDLKARGYDAMYLAVGAQVGKSMGVANEDCPHVLSGVRFLVCVKKEGPPQLDGIVAVVGGGNTAIDVSRTAVRCGAEKVSILYRRTMEEMPADKEEIEDAIEEGVEVRLLTAPKRVVTDNGTLIGLECFEMYLGDPDESGRRRPLPKKDSEFMFKCDHIISAIGQDCDLSLLANRSLGEIKTRGGKTIEVDQETMATNIEGVFAGGDAVTGPMAAVDAIGAGRKAANVIDRYLMTGRLVKIHDEFLSSKTALAELDTSFFEQLPKTDRTKMHKLEPFERIKTYREVDIGITAEEVAHEASRCLTCGCKTLNDCDLRDCATETGAQQKKYTGKFKKYKVDTRHPYIVLDPNKCISCGRCVRYCGDLIGIYALGFINRGFETVVKPTLDKPLAETSCISCGNCIEVCPTGAIEFASEHKNPGQFTTFPYRSLCSDCGVGCEIDVNAFDRDIFYITAKPYNTHVEGELCKKGRFESAYLRNRERISVSFEDGKGMIDIDTATSSIAKALKGIKDKHGRDSILFLASPMATMEELFLFASIARSFDSSFIVSTGDLLRGVVQDIRTIIGTSIPTVRQDDVAQAKVIVNIGPGLTQISPVFGFKVKRAVKNGATLVQIGTADSELTRYVSTQIEVERGHERDAIDAVCKTILERGIYDKEASEKVEGFKEYADQLRARDYTSYMAQAEEVAKLLTDPSLNLIIIYNNDNTDVPALDALKSASYLLVMTGKTDKPFNGMIVTRSHANGQGHRDLLFSGAFDFTTAERIGKIREAFEQGKVKAVVSLNEDLDISDVFPEEVLNEVEFIAAISMCEGSLTRAAKIVIPYAPLLESEGSMVSFDGKVVKIEKVFKPATGHTNLDVLNRIFHYVTGRSYSLDYVRELIAAKLPLYAGLTDNAKDSFYLGER